jgi:RNA recognition motif-containing protein
VGKKLYVGNLSNDMTDSHLYTLFSLHGRVRSAQVVIDRETGRSKGFGFVEMDCGDQAQAAIKALNGSGKRSCPRILASVPSPVTSLRTQTRYGWGRAPGFAYN